MSQQTDPQAGDIREDKAAYFRHEIKCLDCGLHFVVMSWWEAWPNAGTTRDLQVREATGLIYCPECGSLGPKIHQLREADGFIFQEVFSIGSNFVSFG